MESSKLFQAISEQKEEDLLKLLDDQDSTEDLNVRDSDGKTLLHHAVLKIKSINVFKSLINKVDFTVRDADGNSAIDLMLDDEDFPDEAEQVLKETVKQKVKKCKKEEASNMLLLGWLDSWSNWEPEAEEEDPEEEEVKEFLATLPQTKEKIDKLHRDIRESKWDDIREALAADGSLLGAVDKTGYPPLHKAVILGETNIVENIVKEFVEALTYKDNMCRTALHHAAGRRDGGHFYKILVDAGAKDDDKDLNSRTPAEINDDPNILPGERTANRLSELLSRPAIVAKKKKQVQAEQTQTETAEEGATEEKPKSPAPAPKVESKEPKPVQMYISPDVRQNPPPTTIDGKYVSDNLGHALTLCLAEIADKRPWDPVEYLAMWLYKYQENVDFNKRQQDILAQIRCEEKAKEVELESAARRKAELHRLQEEELRKREAEQEEKKRREQEELQRQAKEAVLSQQPGLETVMEDKEEDDAPKERSHKDENGQTELHKLAAQSAADLTTLLNMGYSPADRDVNNKTARDIAVECKKNENVEAIDKYVHKLMEMEEFDTLEGLLLGGYDKFDVVLDKMKLQSTSLPEGTEKFIAQIPTYQESIATLFKAIQTEGIQDLTAALERPKLAGAKDEQGRSPLHIAVLVGHKDAVEHLASNFPVTMKCKDNLERTPLHYAMAVSEDMVAILEKHGADTLAKDCKQKSPTFYKDSPDEIQVMKGSLTALYTGTQDPTELETSQQEAEGQQEDAGQQQAE